MGAINISVKYETPDDKARLNLVSLRLLLVLLLLFLSLHHNGVKELLHGIGVPLVDGQGLCHLILLVEKLDDWVRPSHVLDREPRVPRGPLALYERRDLRVRSQSSSADL